MQPYTSITACTGESITAAESAGATVARSFVGGVVAGGAAALLVVGILRGSWKLKRSCKWIDLAVKGMQKRRSKPPL